MTTGDGPGEFPVRYDKRGHPGMTTINDSFLTMADVAQRYHTTIPAVRQWRHVGYGPESFKVGARVLYTEEALLRFEQSLLTAN